MNTTNVSIKYYIAIEAEDWIQAILVSFAVKTNIFILKVTVIEASIVLFIQQRLKNPRFMIFMHF